MNPKNDYRKMDLKIVGSKIDEMRNEDWTLDIRLPEPDKRAPGPRKLKK